MMWNTTMNLFHNMCKNMLQINPTKPIEGGNQFVGLQKYCDEILPKKLTKESFNPKHKKQGHNLHPN